MNAELHEAHTALTVARAFLLHAGSVRYGNSAVLAALRWTRNAREAIERATTP